MGSGSSIPAKTKCAICQSDCPRAATARPASCPRHFFHRECLVKWAQRKNTCPLDNKEFDEIVTASGTRLVVQRRDSDDESESTNLAALLAGAALLQAAAAGGGGGGGGSSNFKCSICNSSNEEELAEPDACDHRFHRSCLLTKLRQDPHCPARGCNRRVKKVHCQHGDVLEVGVGLVRGIHAALTCPDDFKCGLCDDDDKTQERAKPDCCATEFHRECLVEAARRDEPCPHCKKEIKEIKCLFGDTLTVNSGSNNSGGNLFLANLLDIGFECKLCETNNPNERAKILSCGHVFHWDCVQEHAKKDLSCPICFKSFSEIQRQLGDAVVTCQQSSLRSLIAAGTAPENFKCELCNETETTKERGEPNCCGHEFHRDCLLEKLRKADEARCPKCNAQVSEIKCTFGAVLKIARKT